MEKFEVFQLEDTNLNQLKGGGLFGGTTNTNCATSFTQETRRDKDSNAACESVKSEIQTVG